MSSPFSRPQGGEAVKDETKTFYHGFPLPPKMRGYDPDADRDSYGRYRLPDPTGQKEGRKAFTRATTGAKVLDDTYNLSAWDVRQVVTGIHSKPELLDLFPEFGDYQDQRQALEEIAESARVAAGSKANSRWMRRASAIAASSPPRSGDSSPAHHWAIAGSSGMRGEANR